MKVLVTFRDTPQAGGGIAHYYRALRAQFVCNPKYFTVGSRTGRRNLWRDGFRIVRDWVLLWRELGREYDLVVINPSLRWLPLIRDGMSLLLAKVRRRPAVVFFRGWDDRVAEVLLRRGRWLFFLVFGRADALILLSTRFAETTRALGYKGPIFVETTTVDDRLLQSAATRAKGNGRAVRLLFLARIERKKGIFPLLESIRLVGDFKSVHWVIAGEGGARESAEEYVLESGLRNVEFVGYVNGDRKAESYRDADIYVLPSSHAEGMPNSVLEAKAFGLPIITTPIGGVPDYFENGKMGFMIESGDPHLIAEKVRYLIDHPERRKDMCRYNVEYAGRYFLASKVAKRLESIWAAVMAGNAEAGTTYHWKDCG